jgi:superfamily II DNA/RNA helicase
LRVLRRREFGPTRLIHEPRELTSRARSSQISDTLRRLDRTFIGVKKSEYPIDVLLASNMLSVGVDIDRLSLMVMSAQPKTTAEYIQASSRVGRVFPGLVVEVYNWIRPRDTSHYERFAHYHDTFYRHVEATSVTPFSARARDRAMPGVLVSYARQNDPRLAQERDANRFDSHDPEVQKIIASLRARAADVTESEEVARDTEGALRNLAGEWDRMTGGDHPLVYTGRGLKNNDATPVLLRRMEVEGARGYWSVSGSLREIEPEVDVVLKDEEID